MHRIKNYLSRSCLYWMSAVFIVVLSLNALPAFSQSSDKKPTKVAEIDGMKKFLDEAEIAFFGNIPAKNVVRNDGYIKADIKLNGAVWTLIVRESENVKKMFMSLSPQNPFKLSDWFGSGPGMDVADALAYSALSLNFAIDNIKIPSKKVRDIPGHALHYLKPFIEENKAFELKNGFEFVGIVDLGRSKDLKSAMKFLGAQSTNVRIDGSVSPNIIKALVDKKTPKPDITLTGLLPTFRPQIGNFIKVGADTQLGVTVSINPKKASLSFEGDTTFKIDKQMIDVTLSMGIVIPVKGGKPKFPIEITIFENEPWNQAFGIPWMTVENYALSFEPGSDGSVEVTMSGDTSFGSKHVLMTVGFVTGAETVGLPLPSELAFEVNDGKNKVGTIGLTDMVSVFNLMNGTSGLGDKLERENSKLQKMKRDDAECQKQREKRSSPSRPTVKAALTTNRIVGSVGSEKDKKLSGSKLKSDLVTNPVQHKKTSNSGLKPNPIPVPSHRSDKNTHLDCLLPNHEAEIKAQSDKVAELKKSLKKTNYLDPKLVPIAYLAGVKKGSGPKIHMKFDNGLAYFDMSGELDFLGTTLASVEKAHLGTDGIELIAESKVFPVGVGDYQWNFGAQGEVEFVARYDEKKGVFPPPRIKLQGKAEMPIFGGKVEFILSIYPTHGYFKSAGEVGPFKGPNYLMKGSFKTGGGIQGIEKLDQIMLYWRLHSSVTSDPVGFIREAGLKNIDVTIDYLQGELDKLQPQLDKAKNDVDNLNAKISEQRSIVKKERRNQQKQIDDAQKHLNDLKKQENDAQDKLDRAKARVKDCSIATKNICVFSELSCNKYARCRWKCTKHMDVPDVPKVLACQADNVVAIADVTAAGAEHLSIEGSRIAASQTLSHLKQGLAKIPVDADPRVAVPLAARGVAIGALDEFQNLVNGFDQLKAIEEQIADIFNGPSEDLFVLNEALLTGDLQKALSGKLSLMKLPGNESVSPKEAMDTVMASTSSGIIMSIDATILGKRHKLRIPVDMMSYEKTADALNCISLGIIAEKTRRLGYVRDVIPIDFVSKSADKFLQCRSRMEEQITAIKEEDPGSSRPSQAENDTFGAIFQKNVEDLQDLAKSESVLDEKIRINTTKVSQLHIAKQLYSDQIAHYSKKSQSIENNINSCPFLEKHPWKGDLANLVNANVEPGSVGLRRHDGQHLTIDSQGRGVKWKNNFGSDEMWQVKFWDQETFSLISLNKIKDITYEAVLICGGEKAYGGWRGPSVAAPGILTARNEKTHQVISCANGQTLNVNGEQIKNLEVNIDLVRGQSTLGKLGNMCTSDNLTSWNDQLKKSNEALAQAQENLNETNDSLAQTKQKITDASAELTASVAQREIQ